MSSRAGAARLNWWLLAAIAAAGVVFRIGDLDRYPGLDPDEVEGALAWFGDSPVWWYVYPSGRLHLNPIAPLLLWPFAAWAEAAAWVVRVPALLMGIAAIGITFLAVRRTFDAQAAGLAAAMTATMPILIAYSRQAWDLAYVPACAALVIGLAYSRRLWWTLAAVLVFFLVHPTGAFVGPLAAAPFLYDAWLALGRRPRGGLLRALLASGAAAGYAGTYVLLSSFAMEFPPRPESLAPLLDLAVQRLADSALVLQFAASFWHAMAGGLVWAEFLGVPAALTAAGPAAAVAVWAAGLVLLSRQGARDAVALLAALPFGVLAQFIAVGTPELIVPLKARYFLWAAVPVCVSIAVLLAGLSRAVPRVRPGLVVASAFTALWALGFHSHYMSAFRETGGASASLDYRAAPVQPKAQVLDVVRRHRGAGGRDAALFVGEGRLHIALRYLAQGDASLRVLNLGAAHYRLQSDDRAELDRLAGLPVDVFFVDYCWGEIDGEIREIHAQAARDPATVVAPWALAPIETITTANGRPLLRVWRLTPR